MVGCEYGRLLTEPINIITMDEINPAVAPVATPVEPEAAPMEAPAMPEMPVVVPEATETPVV